MRSGLRRARRSRTTLRIVLAGLTVCLALAGVALADSITSGRIGPALNLTGNGHLLHPAGRLTTVGDFPTGSAVMPGGHIIWVADCGHGEDDIKVVSIASGAVLQTLPLPGCYGGVAFAPDGRHAYVSGEPTGSSPTEGPTQGGQGDVIHIFSVNPGTGEGTEQAPLALPSTSGGSGRTNSLPPVSGTGTAQPEGLAVSPDGRYLVVALNAADDADVVNLATNGQTIVAVGQYPCDVVFDPQGRAYVSNEYAGTVSVIDPARARVTATISGFGGALGDPGSHPEGMAADPHRHQLYVAVTDRDTIAVVDTDTDKITHLVSVGRPQGLGTEPVKLAISPDGTTLYSADAGEDAVAAITLSARPARATAPAGARRRTIYRTPTVGAILTYERHRAHAARLLRRARGRARRSAARAYGRTVGALAARYLTLRPDQACGGPSRAQARAWVSAFQRALGIRSAARRRAAEHAAGRRLPPVLACPQTNTRIVYRMPSVGAISTFVARRAAAARTLRRAPGRARAAARKQYARTIRRLTRRYLSARAGRACHGPTFREAEGYIRAIERAVSVRSRRRRLALERAAAARLPRIGTCSASRGPAVGIVPNLPADQLIGRIPTAAYPDDVQTTPQGQLIWIAGKGFGSGPNPDYYFGGARTQYQTPPNTYGTYVLDLLIGRVGVLPVPTDQQVVADTPAANAQVMPSNQESQPAGSPIPAQTGHPSAQIKHVFYIVRENRTYDQVFGSDPRGDGSAGLELFDDNGVSGPTGGITPNAHALARQFPLLDHFYEDSEVSVDGHIITAGATANDYVQKATAANYSNRRGTYDFGIFPVTFPPDFFIFDQAAKQGVSFRDFGEAVGTAPTGNAPNRPEFAKVEQGVAGTYPNNLFLGCLTPNQPASCTQDSGSYKGTGTVFAGQSRFNVWYPEFESEVAAGKVPTFNYLILPNDHTNGTTAGDPTPQAFIADNDLALGQMVDAISHSSIWPSTAIFVVEDDSQDGADHVDSHRSPAFVISPWARHGAVINTRYDQYSVLRTMELITGLDPLGLNDALATPMYDAFISGSQTPDDTPYNVIAPSYPLTTKNTPSSPLAGLSRELPWNRLDAVPQAISDQILWASVHGAGSTPPAAGPDASPAEVDRAAVVRSMLRQDPTVFESGSGTGPGRAGRALGGATGAAGQATSSPGAASSACPITWACRAGPANDP
jgi:YVTN family beta-propeller protein